MRIRILLVTAASAVLTLTAPSSAAPDRTVTLSEQSRTASWSSEPAVGSYVGSPPVHSVTRCAEPAFDCDHTLIELTVAGSLRVDLNRGSLSLPYTGYAVALYRSSASGEKATRIAYHAAYGGTASAVGAELGPGFYLAEISWDEGGGSFDATATLTPAGPPSAPSDVRATAGNASAVVSWTAAQGNRAPITGYTVTADPGGAGCATTGAPSCTVTGLTNGTAYTFTATATNSVGAGPASAASDPVTPAGSPFAPSAVHATAGDASAAVSWTAAEGNGAPVTGYTVTAGPGGASCTTTGATGCVVTGLTNGTAYTFTVTATNRVGAGPASAASNPVTPMSPYTDTQAPTAAVTTSPATVSPSASALFGFSGSDPGRPEAVLQFRCRLDAGVLAACTSPVSYTGLSDGQHTFHVHAVDEAGNVGPTISRSWRVDTVIPTVSTTAPPAVSLAGTVGLSFTGADTGGSGVTGYDARYRRAPYDGTFGAFAYPASSPDWAAPTANSLTLPAAKGYTYCLSVRARDRAGNISDWSAEGCSSVPLDDRSLSASSGWTRRTGDAYYAGTVTSSTTKGATLTRSSVRAKRLAIVATRCSGCGTIGVYWNGVLLKQINLHATTTAQQRVISLATFATLETGTVTIKTLNGGRTYIDGLAVNRT